MMDWQTRFNFRNAFSPLSVRRLAGLTLIAAAYSLLSISSPFSADSIKTKSRHPSFDMRITDAEVSPIPLFPEVARGVFTLRNAGDQDALLLSVTSPACNAITPNQSSQALVESWEGGGDIFSRLTIPRGGTMVFPKVGYHLLCLGYKGKFTKETKVSFTFHFREGDIPVVFPVSPD